MAAVLAAWLPALCLGAVPGDRVTSLPGWSGALPSEHYSGYLSVGKMSVRRRRHTSTLQTSSASFREAGGQLI